jgi:2-(1,2-epoxy-1,2-dihydrophenyl)acetyl-CoA isomerase
VREGGEPGDLGYLRPAGREERPGFGAAFEQILGYLHSAISEIRRAPKPFVAAVDGVAAAGGFGIAMACDLVFASERARFEWAYGKTGLTGAESSTFLLPRLLGFRRAMDLVLRNPRLDAAAARELGLVNEVWPSEGFEERVLAEAERLAAGPTRAFGVAKALLNRAAGLDRLEEHLGQELEELVRVAGSEDFAAGLEGFFEKRPARFGGR